MLVIPVLIAHEACENLNVPWWKQRDMHSWIPREPSEWSTASNHSKAKRIKQGMDKPRHVALIRG
jgi:hypothetical protein